MHLFVVRYLQRLPDILACQDIDLRIAAGETIALFYELGRSDNEVRALIHAPPVTETISFKLPD